MERRKKTRNQRKREVAQAIVLFLAVVIGWLICTHLFLIAWASHPAEQPVSGSEYLQSLQVEGEVYVHSR